MTQGLQTWVVILCHGGQFVLTVYEGSKLIHKKSEKKYVMRSKQGGRQANKDRTSNVMTSVGSQMRRENEKMLNENITEYMEEARPFIEKADVVFLHAPGMNKNLFLSQSKPLAGCHHKVRSILFKSKKANYTEAVDLMKKITEVKIHFNTAYPAPKKEEVAG